MGKIVGRYKVGKHFKLDISEQGFSYLRDGEAIKAEAALDGFYAMVWGAKTHPGCGSPRGRR